MLIPLLAYSVPLLGVLGALVLLGFWLAGIYNRLVSLRARNKNAFAQPKESGGDSRIAAPLQQLKIPSKLNLIQP